MHLIIDHVVKFDHIDNANCCLLVETFTGFPIIQICMTVSRNSSLVAVISNFINSGTIKNRRRELHSQFLSRPSKNSFIDLPKVHTARYAKGVKDDINRSSIFKEW